MRVLRHIPTALFALALTACSRPASSPPQIGPPETESPSLTYLSPVQHLIRVSLDLRGVRPTLGELQDIQANPGNMRSYIRSYMSDPRFADRVKEIWNEAFLTRQDTTFFPPPPALTSYLTADDFARAAGNEPLELVAHVVTNDRPFSEVVTAPYTVANGVLANFYNISRPEAPPDQWVESLYQDGRPHSGVLSSTDFHTRWRTTDSNKNRGRANAWTRSLLCFDFLSRDVIVDTSINLADPNAVNNAVRTNPSCASCHQTLDPIGSYLYGWFIPNEIMGNPVMSYPLKTYSPSAEPDWQTQTGRAPGYFGQTPGQTFDALGKAMAADGRFSMCAVKRFEAGFTGKYLQDADLDFYELDRLHNYFVADNMNAKDMIEEILMSPQYRVMGPAQGFTVGPTDPNAPLAIGLKLLGPEQLDRMLGDLAGFQWKMAPPDGYDLLQNDIYGFREMVGGYDSVYVTAPAHTVNATHILTLRMAAADAASKIVDRELSGSGPVRLLTDVTASETTQSAVEKQIADLDLLLFGEAVAPGSPETSDAWTLWSTVYARSGSTTYAWKVTLAAYLSDERIAFY